MQYIIMLAIVLGLALVDFIFGFLKGYVKHNINSQKMRQRLARDFHQEHGCISGSRGLRIHHGYGNCLDTRKLRRDKQKCKMGKTSIEIFKSR